MKTVAELVAFVDGVLDPALDVDGAFSRLGRAERWGGELAYVQSADPRLTRVVVETAQGELTGVQSHLAEPLDTTWTEIEAALGPREEAPPIVDGWTMPVRHRFDRDDDDAPGRVYLDTFEDGGRVRVERVVVRRGRWRPTP